MAIPCSKCNTKTAKNRGGKLPVGFLCETCNLVMCPDCAGRKGILIICYNCNSDELGRTRKGA